MDLPVPTLPLSAIQRHLVLCSCFSSLAVHESLCAPVSQIRGLHGKSGLNRLKTKEIFLSK